MKICLNCKFEYESNEEKCPKCGFSEIAVVEPKKEWHVLTTVANDIEFGIVAGVLQMGDIPFVREVKGIDGFMQVILGMPLAGIDILVPESRFEEAYGLLHPNEEDQPEEIDSGE